MLIRSKLDYGCIIYNSASPTALKILDPISNKALRTSTGCFKSTPRETLHVLANEKPLHLRRRELSLRYYYKIRGYPENPTFNSAVDTSMKNLFQIKNLQPPFSIRITNYKNQLQINNVHILPSFSYSRLNIAIPTWSLERVIVNRDLCIYPKATTPEQLFKVCFAELRKALYGEFEEIYTDGSKSVEGVGAAAVYCGAVRSHSLPVEASIFTAEATAIQLALNIAQDGDKTKYVIMSDSSSVLFAIENRSHKHPLIRKIQHKIASLNAEDKTVQLCWIPGHAGIAGNERAYEMAKRAIHRTVTDAPMHYRDMIPVMREAIRQKWNQLWRESGQKMVEIRPDIGPWKTEGTLKRRDEIVTNRLRAGHTLLTHGYLMDNTVPDIAPYCELCNESSLTVKHVLLHCTAVDDHRRAKFPIYRARQNVTMCDLLGDDSTVSCVIHFARAINMYCQI
uniref:ribonuclease H n=1 Tax=Hirondellea gigas TaxID=1518452 RepID=A0A2P2HXV0_9CRUS